MTKIKRVLELNEVINSGKGDNILGTLMWIWGWSRNNREAIEDTHWTIIFKKRSYTIWVFWTPFYKFVNHTRMFFIEFLWYYRKLEKQVYLANIPSIPFYFCFCIHIDIVVQVVWVLLDRKPLWVRTQIPLILYHVINEFDEPIIHLYEWCSTKKQLHTTLQSLCSLPTFRFF